MTRNVFSVVSEPSCNRNRRQADRNLQRHLREPSTCALRRHANARHAERSARFARDVLAARVVLARSPQPSTPTTKGSQPSSEVSKCIVRAWLAPLALLTACVDLGVAPPPPPDMAPEPDGGFDGGLKDGENDGDNGEIFEAEISTLVFRPNPLEITRGITVRWTNLDPVPHTVTEGDLTTLAPLFDAPLPGRGSTFEYTFTEAGEWIYFCRTHPNTTLGSRLVVR